MNYIFPIRAQIFFENQRDDFDNFPKKDICEIVSDVCLYPIRGFGRTVDADDNITPLGLGRRVFTVISMTVLLPLLIVPTVIGLALLFFSTAHETKCAYIYNDQEYDQDETWSFPLPIQNQLV